jgi:hypothetical protein
VALDGFLDSSRFLFLVAVLVVGPMPCQRPAFRPKSRKATLGALRLLATLVALLLTASSLGQAAHFLLVQHAICAEHGELLELAERSAHVAAAHEHEAGNKVQARVSSAEAAGHDHCQILARSQKQPGLPPAPALTIVPAGATSASCSIASATRAVTTLPRLAVAPKTSPPLVSRV